MYHLAKTFEFEIFGPKKKKMPTLQFRLEIFFCSTSKYLKNKLKKTKQDKFKIILWRYESLKCLPTFPLTTISKKSPYFDYTILVLDNNDWGMVRGKSIAQIITNFKIEFKRRFGPNLEL